MLFRVTPLLLHHMGLRTRPQRAWAMYDWANSAYATVVMAAILPPFFSSYFAEGLESAHATSLYAVLLSATLLLTALLSPVLGTLADVRRSKKRFLACSTVAGALASALLAFTPQGAWGMASLWTGLAALAFGLSMVFYEGLLPSVAAHDELDRVSSAGYALGYIGGGLLLALNTVWIFFPERFGLPDATTAIRASFISVGAWWLLFSIPLWRRVEEPAGIGVSPGSGTGALTTTVRQLLNTFREIRRYRDLFLFLVAFWLYNDGIGTIIKMAAIFGSEIGIAMHHLVLALLMTQFIAVPFALGFGALGSRRGPKAGLYLALAVYVAAAWLGAFIRETWHFYALAALVGTVQGGAQALSRSLFARMVPRSRAGEFFGFYSVSAKFAALFGPLLFAAVSLLTGTSRYAVASIIVFFVLGLAMLRCVDVERGERAARATERDDAGRGRE